MRNILIFIAEDSEKKKEFPFFFLRATQATKGIILRRLAAGLGSSPPSANWRRRIALGLITFILLALVVIFFAFYFMLKNQAKTICFNENCFQAEMAVDLEERQKGLMFREKLRENEAMLFVFEKEGNHPFWMKNMKIALDIVWLGPDFEVRHIERDVPACEQDPCPTYRPEINAKYVLEIKAGQSQKIGLAVGDKAELKWRAFKNRTVPPK